MAKRKAFALEEKLQAVAAVEAGRPREEVAAELGVGGSSVYRWCQEHPHA